MNDEVKQVIEQIEITQEEKVQKQGNDLTASLLEGIKEIAKIQREGSQEQQTLREFLDEL